MKASLRKTTEQHNRDAFKNIYFRPKYFKDVSNLSLTTSLLDKEMSIPVGIGPSAMHKIAHHQGEVATALAAGSQGTIYVLSSFSTTSIEEIGEKAPNTEKWIQMYIYKNLSINLNFIRRAEKANFSGIVVTSDAPVHGKTYLKYEFDLPDGLRMENFVGITDRPSQIVSSSFTIKDLKWIVNATKLPVFAKGILTKEGAIKARDAGCKGVFVSTHGGRQLDGVPASIEALPEVVKAVGKDMTVVFDSGVRGGDDVFKALALGAKYVFIGRPVFFGLAVDGQKGVEGVLNTLKSELENVMALNGCSSIKDIKRNRVVHKQYFENLMKDEL